MRKSGGEPRAIPGARWPARRGRTKVVCESRRGIDPGKSRYHESHLCRPTSLAIRLRDIRVIRHPSPHLEHAVPPGGLALFFVEPMHDSRVDGFGAAEAEGRSHGVEAADSGARPWRTPRWTVSACRSMCQLSIPVQEWVRSWSVIGLKYRELYPRPRTLSSPEVRYPLFTDVWVQSSRMTHVWKCGSPQTTLIVLELLECILHLLGSVKLLEPECPRGRFR